MEVRNHICYIGLGRHQGEWTLWKPNYLCQVWLCKRLLKTGYQQLKHMETSQLSEPKLPQRCSWPYWVLPGSKWPAYKLQQHWYIAWGICQCRRIICTNDQCPSCTCFGSFLLHQCPPLDQDSSQLHSILPASETCLPLCSVGHATWELVPEGINQQSVYPTQQKCQVWWCCLLLAPSIVNM